MLLAFFFILTLFLFLERCWCCWCWWYWLQFDFPGLKTWWNVRFATMFFSLHRVHFHCAALFFTDFALFSGCSDAMQPNNIFSCLPPWVPEFFFFWKKKSNNNNKELYTINWTYNACYTVFMLYSNDEEASTGGQKLSNIFTRSGFAELPRSTATAAVAEAEAMCFHFPLYVYFV